MNPEYQGYIKALLRQGFDRERIKADCISHGFAEAEFDHTYEAASASLTPPAPPTPPVPQGEATPPTIPSVPTPGTPETQAPPVPPTPPTSPAAPQASAADSSEEARDTPSLSTPHPISARTIGTVIIVFSLAIALFVGTAFAMGWVKPPAFISGLFSSAPFNEDTLLTDISQSFTTIKSGSYTTGLHVYTTDKEEDVYPFPDEEATRSGGLAAFIPSDFSLLFELSGQFDLENLSSPNTHNQLVAAFESDDFNLNADLEFMIAEKDGIFFRVNRFPSLFVDLSPIKGSWVHLLDEPIENKIDSLPSAFDKEEFESFKQQYSLLLRIADEEKLFALANAPTKEEVGEVSAYRYTLELQYDNIIPFFRRAITELNAAFGEDSIFDGADMEEVNELEEELSESYVDYFNKHWPLSVWADADGTIIKVGVLGRVVLPDDQAPQLAGKQVNIDISAVLSDHNQGITVQVPVDAMSIEEAAELVPLLEEFAEGFEAGYRGEREASSRQKAHEASLKQSMNNLRIYAEIYYNESMSYADFCDSREVASVAFDNQTFRCDDSDDEYRIVTLLNEEDSIVYCIDSQGQTGEFWLAEMDPSTMTCPDSDSVMYETSSAANPGFDSAMSESAELELDFENAHIVTGYSGSGFTNGQSLLVVNVLARNNSTTPLQYSETDLRVRDSSGTVFFALPESAVGDQPRFQSPFSYGIGGRTELRNITVLPNEEVSGAAVFYIPKTPTPEQFTLRYQGGLPVGVAVSSECRVGSC